MKPPYPPKPQRAGRPNPQKPADSRPEQRSDQRSAPRASEPRGPARPSGAAQPKRPMPAVLGPRQAAEEVGSLVITDGWDDYRLLDMGEGEKLERYGALTVVRPEPQAMGPRRLDPSVWAAAGAAFTGDVEEDGPGRWRTADGIGTNWQMSVMGLPIVCQLTAFRHVGIFAEQIAHWNWMAERLKAHRGPEKPKLLNLFGYTGVASLIAANAGAEVTHVDASKKSVAWGRENQALAGLDNAPIRWIVDDAVKFAEREVRRGKRYDGILLDPPRFGRGPDGEVWSLEADLPHLLDLTRQILAPGPSFMALTAYAIRASFLSIHEITADLIGHRPGTIASGELAVRETGDPARPGRLLATSMFSRFTGA